MRITPEALEEAVLALLCYGDKAVDLAARLQDGTLFSTKVHQLIAQAAIEYINTYHACPGVQMEMLLETAMQRGEEGILLGKRLAEMFKKFPTLDVRFIFDQLNQFIRIQRMQQAIKDSAELLHQFEPDRASERLFEAFTDTNTSVIEDHLVLGLLLLLAAHPP